MTQAEEAKVLAAVRAGDESAFAALAERHRRRLHLYCYRKLGSLEEAEDVVQVGPFTETVEAGLMFWFR